jgi:hypothetical protein
MINSIAIARPINHMMIYGFVIGNVTHLHPYYLDARETIVSAEEKDARELAELDAMFADEDISEMYDCRLDYQDEDDLEAEWCYNDCSETQEEYDAQNAYNDREAQSLGYENFAKMKEVLDAEALERRIDAAAAKKYYASLQFEGDDLPF